MASAAVRPPVFILSAGTVGDIYPPLRIGKALQRRGHTVSFIGPEIHQAHVERAGLPFHSVFSTAEQLEVMNNPDVWHPQRGVRVMLRSLGLGVARMVNILTRLAGDENSILLTHPLAVPAAAIMRARQAQWRVVTFYLAPANLRSVHDLQSMGPLPIPRWLPHSARRWLWRMVDKHMMDPAAVPQLNALRHKHGLPPLRHYLEHVYGAADLSLTLFPDWFSPAPPDWPKPLHKGYFQLYDPLQHEPLPAALCAFLAQGDAPIVFTPGSGNRHAHDYFAAAQKAALRLGKRAIFLTAYRDQIPPSLPDSIFWQDYVPLSQLLPHTALLVHHGGIGTTAEGLRAGIPQLVVPLAYDQFDNAARLAQLGVGASLSVRGVKHGKLACVLNGLLNSSLIRQRCKDVATRFAKPDDEEALCRAIAAQDQIR